MTEFIPPRSCIENGVLWKEYIIDFKTDEGDFSFNIMATSLEHAAALVTDIRLSATLAGEHQGSIITHDEE